MKILKKVFVFWCWYTCNFINQIDSQYNSIWQQQQQLQNYLPQLPQNQRQPRTLIKISSSGFLPFENNILPYFELQRIFSEMQQQDQQQQQRFYQQPQYKQQSHQYSSTLDYSRGGRYMQWQTGQQPKNLLEYAKKLQSPKIPATTNHYKNNYHGGFINSQPNKQYYYKNPKWFKVERPKLKRTSLKSNHYKLYDTDGEYLLDLRYHNDDKAHADGDYHKVAKNVNPANKQSADIKPLNKIMFNNFGIGTKRYNEDTSERGVPIYDNRKLINNNNNRTKWHMSASTVSKSTPIMVEDFKTKSDTLPKSPEMITTATQKHVQHIWLQL